MTGFDYVRAGFAADVSSDWTDVVIVLRGELDMASAPELTRVLDGVVGFRGPRVVLDLSRLEFIDACGLHVIESARDRLSGQGRMLVVRNPVTIVRRVLGICALSDWREALKEIVLEPAWDHRVMTGLRAQGL